MSKALRVSLVVLLVVIMVIGLVGCDSANEPNDEQPESNGVVDESDTPQRIISFFPSNTEILVALDLLDSLVAVTVYDDYPADIQDQVEYVFTDGLNPNVEQALSLDPDLIVFGAHDEALVDTFAKFDIPTIEYDPQSVAEVYAAIIDLGALTNRSAKAEALVAQMKAEQSKLAELIGEIPMAERKTVWVEISDDLWTVGSDTFMNELITNAGGINIVEQSGWLQYSEELVLEQNPDIIFTTYGNFEPNAVEKVLKREGWSGLTAIQTGEVYDLDNNLVSRQGPRIIEAMWLFASKLYPELFADDQAA